MGSLRHDGCKFVVRTSRQEDTEDLEFAKALQASFKEAKKKRTKKGGSTSRLCLRFFLACASLFVSLVSPVLVNWDMFDDHC